jgi:hypothetical protein
MAAACPMADRIEKMWTENFPMGSNVTAQVYYDPHFIGFNNQHFDCHPEGDAILFKNAPADFEIHARHKPVHQTYRPSVIDAFALKIKSDIIQYNVNNGKFLVNGKNPTFKSNWTWLPASQTSIVMLDGNRFHIYTELGARVTVYNCGCYNMNITLTLPRALAESASSSLFGNLIGSHGETISAKGLFI